ncbi:MAG: efflux RND transporter periplasmic adaptor subunit [Candidatus Coprenecus sp.]
MKYFWSFVIISLFLCSCKSGSDSAEGEKLGRISHSEKVDLVDTMHLKLSDFENQILSNGKVYASSRCRLRFKSSGVVSSINFNNGDYVREGDIIACLDSTLAVFSFNQARISLENAKNRLADVLIGFGFSADEGSGIPDDIMEIASVRSGYAEALNSYYRVGTELKNMSLTAPFSGKVAFMKGVLYEETPNDYFCTLIDDSKFDVKFNILETDLSFLRIGQDVEVSPFADPSIVCRGKVVNYSPSVNSKGQIEVCARISNPGRGIVDGMNVSVKLIEKVANQWVVPKGTVVSREDKDVLFVYMPETSTVRWVYVNVLKSNSTSLMVVPDAERDAELKDGDVVVISGNLNLAHQSYVKVR